MHPILKQLQNKFGDESSDCFEYPPHPPPPKKPLKWSSEKKYSQTSLKWPPKMSSLMTWLLTGGDHLQSWGSRHYYATVMVDNWPHCCILYTQIEIGMVFFFLIGIPVLYWSSIQQRENDHIHSVASCYQRLNENNGRFDCHGFKLCY